MQPQRDKGPKIFGGKGKWFGKTHRGVEARTAVRTEEGKDRDRPHSTEGVVGAVSGAIARAVASRKTSSLRTSFAEGGKGASLGLVVSKNT